MTEPIHACFISYRHPERADSREASLIRHVVKAISDHVEMYTHQHGIYFDKNRLVPGYQYDERLAEAICRSACMVIVYWPAYLESEYCLKEIRAMLEIENRRRARLGDALHGSRLFIPLIVRGALEELPEGVRTSTHSLDYSKQALRPDLNLGDDPAMSEQLFEIAKYIKTLCDTLRGAPADVFGGCKEFGFNAVAARADAEVTPTSQRFPGR